MRGASGLDVKIPIAEEISKNSPLQAISTVLKQLGMQ
jgi:hypothetical protein